MLAVPRAHEERQLLQIHDVTASPAKNAHHVAARLVTLARVIAERALCMRHLMYHACAKSDRRLGQRLMFAEPTISDFVGLLDWHVSKAVERAMLSRSHRLPPKEPCGAASARKPFSTRHVMCCAPAH
jgi:hypothetical protein